MVSHSLGLFPAGKPSSRFTDPEMADSSPSSRTFWSCSLFASRHPSPHCPTLPPPACRHALSEAAPSSPAGLPLASPGDGYLLPAAMHSLGPLPVRHLASRFHLPHS